MNRQNIASSNPTHRTIRTKYRNAIGDTVTVIASVKADSPSAAPVVDRIWAALAPHAKLEPTPMGIAGVVVEEFAGDIPPALVEPQPAPRPNPPNPAATTPKPATVTPQPQAQQPRKKLVEQED